MYNTDIKICIKSELQLKILKVKVKAENRRPGSCASTFCAVLLWAKLPVGAPVISLLMQMGGVQRISNCWF